MTLTARKKRPPPRIVVDAKHRENVVYQLELVKCGTARCRRCRRRPAHGPYWYSYQWSIRKHGTVSKYIGKKLPWEKEP